MNKRQIALFLAMHVFRINVVLSIIVLAMLFYARMASADVKEIRVMVIDTGVDLDHPLLKDKVIPVGGDVKDHHGHGTHVTGLLIYGSLNAYENNPEGLSKLKGMCPEVKIYVCKYWDPQPGESTLGREVECLKKALELNVDYITFSSGGAEFYQDEYDILQKLELKGTLIFAAAGNDKQCLADPTYSYFPADLSKNGEVSAKKNGKVTKTKYSGLSNIIVIGNLSIDENGNANQAETTNYGLAGMGWAVGTSRLSTLPGGKYGKMTGTSQAVPLYLHKILKKRCELGGSKW